MRIAVQSCQYPWSGVGVFSHSESGFRWRGVEDWAPCDGCGRTVSGPEGSSTKTDVPGAVDRLV